jgi:hypothetical protein
MAGPGTIVVSTDRLTRSVWVAIDPQDLVTGRRVVAPLRVTIDGQTAQPIAALSGVYCFTDLGLTPATYTVVVEPLSGTRGEYFRATKALNLTNVPVPGSPLKRNPLTVHLLPRPSYPFNAQATLARGRLVKASDGAGIEGALVKLFVAVSDEGIRTQTDERGEFVVLFPTPAPAATGGLQTFTFNLRFMLDGHPDHDTAADSIKEGSVKALGVIQFPGI